MTDFQEITKEYQQRLDALRKEYTTQAKDAFKSMSNSLFEKYPELESFGWPQFTGYYCDGDPCYFSAWVEPESLRLVIDGTLWDEYDGEVSFYSTYDFDRDSLQRVPKEGFQRQYGMFNDVSSFLSAFDENSLKDLFGDHALVRVTREGVTVDEYDHD